LLGGSGTLQQYILQKSYTVILCTQAQGLQFMHFLILRICTISKPQKITKYDPVSEKDMNIENQLFSQIPGVLDLAKNQVAQVVNTTMTATYFNN